MRNILFLPDKLTSQESTSPGFR